MGTRRTSKNYVNKKVPKGVSTQQSIESSATQNNNSQYDTYLNSPVITECNFPVNEYFVDVKQPL